MRVRMRVVLIVLFGLAALAGPLALLLGADRGAASFGDNEAIGVNELQSATVELGVGSSSVPFNVTRMAPGDVLSGSFDVRNDGTVPLRYAIEAERSVPVGAVDLLEVLVWELAVASPGGCGSAAGRSLFSGPISSAPLIGSAAVGTDPGDRLLEPGEGERICVTVELPLDVSDEFQAASGSVEIVLIAEHAIEGS